ncbi:unnamed protein product [Chironomus riparius]|uniref:Defensin n=1 Tax=Chironomus riparius TaxID=315576 RepID=A0A9N9WY69_9DIPT|nr:unnamed protein product [Chironomus riparius]
MMKFLLFLILVLIALLMFLDTADACSASQVYSCLRRGGSLNYATCACS